MNEVRSIGAARRNIGAPAAGKRWSRQRAAKWAGERGWLVGSNYIPSYAVNQLEMWQPETFNLDVIDRELALAESLGFNNMRVFLHDLLWSHDERGFVERIDQFLTVAQRRGLGTMLVLLDSVWDPNPQLGPQREPTPHVHNSGWVQSPGAAILGDPARHDELRAYVHGMLRRFGNDPRVTIWDLWNEPDNDNQNSYAAFEIAEKGHVVLPLLRKVFGWAREANPSQPLTSGVWVGDWQAPELLRPWERFQLEHSDVITYHTYDPLEAHQVRVRSLRRYGRPLLCTEYMARGLGSTFEEVLPYLRDQRIGAYNWGFVAGRSQTSYPWDSWNQTYSNEPSVWFHDIFRANGTPYSEAEVEVIRSATQISTQPRSGLAPCSLRHIERDRCLCA